MILLIAHLKVAHSSKLVKTIGSDLAALNIISRSMQGRAVRVVVRTPTGILRAERITAREGACSQSGSAGLAFVRAQSSAFDDIDGKAAARSFLVLVLHVAAGITHRLDHLVE